MWGGGEENQGEDPTSITDVGSLEECGNVVVEGFGSGEANVADTMRNSGHGMPSIAFSPGCGVGDEDQCDVTADVTSNTEPGSREDDNMIRLGTRVMPSGRGVGGGPHSFEIVASHCNSEGNMSLNAGSIGDLHNESKEFKDGQECEEIEDDEAVVHTDGLE